MLSFTKYRYFLIVLSLVAAGFYVYSFNLNNNLFWDDEEWIVNNVFVHTISWSNIKFWLTNNTLAGVGLKSNYYRPFLFFTFALDYIMSGTKPLAYHLTSNLIHIVNSILIFWLIRQVFRKSLLAFLVSIFFLVHPLQTEAITYISGRGDALVTMFMLLSLILFYRAELRDKGWFGYEKILSIISLILGLLSRETGIIFPFLALVFYVAALSRDKFLLSIWKGFIKIWPYLAIVIVYGVLRLTVLNFLDTLNFYLEPNIYSENLHIRIFTFLPILGEYAKLLIAPLGLHMERSVTIYGSLLQWPVWFIAIFITGIAYLIYYFYKKEGSRPQDLSLIHTSQFRIWFLAAFWFFIGLGPVSGITPINALIYEHWLYLPMIGFWLVVSFYLVKILDYLKFKRNIIGYWFLVAGLASYLLFLSYQSIQRNILWGNTEEFYKDILKYEPESSRINNNLGNLYFNRENRDLAEVYYKKAVDAGDAFAQPYFNLGSILQSKGDFFGAIQLYEKAVEINPNFYYPYQNLAVIYAQQGNLTKSIENIEKLKTFLPNNPRVYYNSALVYIALNNRAQALVDLNLGLKYVDLDPETGRLIEELIRELGK